MIYMLCGMIVVSITALDQFFKYWIVNNIPLGGMKAFIPHIVSLTQIHNTGAAFSMLEGMRWLLLTITIVAIIGIIIYMVKVKMTALAKVSLSMILGGAIGNAIDRIMNGYVVDMFHLDFMDYAIFNVADCFVVVGGTLFCIYFIFHDYWQERHKKPVSNDEYDDDYDTDSDEPSENPAEEANVDDDLPVVNYDPEPEFSFDKETLAIFDDDYKGTPQAKTAPVPKPVIPPEQFSTDTAVIHLPEYDMPVYEQPNDQKHSSVGNDTDDFDETRIIDTIKDQTDASGDTDGN